MKATVASILAALLLGAGLGAALGYVEARPWSSRASVGAISDPAKTTSSGPEANPVESTAPANATRANASNDEEPRPVAQIDSTTFNFERMERGASMRHPFVVHNAGNVPLTLTFVSHTCKCTAVALNGKQVTESEGDKVPPGGKGVIELEWTAKTPAGPFRHGATFSTSDPAMSRLELVVEGEVVESSTLFPSQIHFNGARIGEIAEQSTTVTSFLEPKVEILSHRLVVVPAEVEQRMQVRVEEVEVDKVLSPQAQAALRVVVTLDAGGSIGPFQGELELETNLKTAQRLTLPVAGAIKGDVSIYGQGWNANDGLLRLRSVKSRDGTEAKLNLMIHGKHAASTQVELARRSPDALQATLGEPIRRGDEQLQIPLTVSIPPGTPPFVLAGESLGIAAEGESASDAREGEIVLKTTHPDAPEVRLRVHATVTP